MWWARFNPMAFVVCWPLNRSATPMAGHLSGHPSFGPWPFTLPLPRTMSLSDKDYTPNQIPLQTRILRTLGSVALLAYGILGVVIDDLVIPGKRSSMHLHGLSAWLMALAIACAAVTLFAVVVDHYDRRNNESVYRRLERWAGKLGWVLAGLATGLATAGIHYPQPSTVTTFSAVLGCILGLLVAAIGFVKTKASQRISESSSIPSRVPAPGTAHTNASTILGWVFLIAGALVLFFSLPGLLGFRITSFVAAAAAIVLIAIGLSLRQPAAKSVDSTTPAAPSQRWTTLRIALLLIIGLAVIWYAKSRQWESWIDQDEKERLAAPAWNYRFEDFTAGISREFLQKQLGKEGFRMRCYGNLKPEERLEPDDQEVCWTIANNTAGIPSRMITFWFGQEGLRQMRMDFGKAEWPEVQKWFEAQGSVLTGSFGREQGGQQIIGRRGRTGLILTSAPGPMNWVMVLWQSREILQERSCAKADSSIGDNWGALCQNWPAWKPQAGFAQQHQSEAN